MTIAFRFEALRSVLATSCLVALVTCLSVSAHADSVIADSGSHVSHELIAKGTRFETDLIVRRTKRTGPVVLVVGGMHGNEPAGAHAAGQIARWEITAGTLIVIPEANRPALAAEKRYTPEAEKALHNLNRNFIVGESGVAKKGVTTTGVMAPQIWNVVEQFSPDWVVDLHEGYDFTRINSKSVGSSVIAGATPEAKEMAKAMMVAVDSEITEADRKFKLKGPPIKGSLARAAASIGLHSMIVETTSKGQSLAVRARQHRLMVDTLFRRLGMIGDLSYVEKFVTAKQAGKTNIALFDDVGVSGKGKSSLSKIWEQDESVTVHRVCSADIRAGALDQFDVFCCSGGSGSGQGNSLQEAGRDHVRGFLDDGGAYIGICGGAYLACENFSWGLRILDAGTKKGNWRRGRAKLPVAITAEGQKYLSVTESSVPITYVNGPILRPANQPDLPDFQVLATFQDEVAENGSPKGIMTGSPAIVMGSYGAGTVYVVSPHPESTPGAMFLIESMTKKIVDKVENDGAKSSDPASGLPALPQGVRK